MIIQCQNCKKKFQIDDLAIPENGRKVQCGNCGTQWIQQKENLKLEKESEISIEKNFHQINPSASLPSKKINKRKIKRDKKIAKSPGLGFIGFIIIFIIVFAATVGILETFKNNLSPLWPQLETQLNFVYESINNILIIIKELFNKY